MAYGTEEWPTLKSYRPLNRAAKQIRLLSLYPSANDSMIRFDLAHHSLAQHQQHHHVEYYALSYVWGEAFSMEVVEVNGERVEIRSTLWHFLYSLRKILQDVADAGSPFKALNGKPADRIFLWIDFLCINQIDIDERNSQVTMMNDIFECASGVIGWIGNPNPETDQAFEFLLNHAATVEAEDSIDASSADRVSAIVTALGTLAVRPYWSRLWIIQEVLLNDSFWLCAGRYTLSWKYYSRLFLRLENNMLRDEEKWHSILPMPFQRMLRLIHIQANPERFGSLVSSLMTIGGNSECTEPRDKVYGMRGLLIPQDREGITVDYRKSVLQVFAEACYSLFSHLSSEFFFNLSSLTGSLNRPLDREERFNTAARAVELNTPFTGTITQCELCAIVEKANDIPFHRHRSLTTDRNQQQRVYIYKREIEVLDADTEGGSVTYVDLAFSTAEMQPGDHLFSVYELGERGPQLVLREHSGGVVIRSLAFTRLCRAGTLDQWRSWLTLGNADDPRAWAGQCCWGAALQLANAHDVAESLRTARLQPDAAALRLKDVNINVVYNEAALMEVLRNSSGLYDGETEGVWTCREARYRPLRTWNSSSRHYHPWSMEVY